MKKYASSSIGIPLSLALLAGLVAYAALPPASVPEGLTVFLGGEAPGPLDYRGGRRLEVRVEGDARQANAVTNEIRARITALPSTSGPNQSPPPRLTQHGNSLVIEVPTREDGDELAVLNHLIRAGELRFGVVVLNAPLLNRIAAAAEGDHRAYEHGIDVTWGDEDGRSFPRVKARELPVLLDWLDAAQTRNPTLLAPAEQRVGFHKRLALGAQDDEADATSWQLYVVRLEPDLKNDHLSDARVLMEGDGEPYLSLTFDAEGARRFGEFTGRNVRQLVAIMLDDEILAAPTVTEPVPGGRVKLNLGKGQSPESTLREAERLSWLVQSRPLPAPLVIVEDKTIEAGVSAVVTWARVAYACAVALAVLVLALVVSVGLRERERPRGPRAAADAPSNDGAGRPHVWRLFVTLACAGGAFGLYHLPIAFPGLDYEGVRASLASGDWSSTFTVPTVFAHGLATVLVAFVVVELFTLVIPPLRRRRHQGFSARKNVNIAVALLSLCFFLVQGHAFSTWFSSALDLRMVNDWLTPEAALAGGLAPGRIGAALCAGTLAYLLLAAVSSSRGLLNGFCAVQLGWALARLLSQGGAPGLAAAAPDQGPTVTSVAALIGGGALVIVATVLTLRRRVDSNGAPVGLRRPSAGVIPAVVAIAVSNTALSLTYSLDYTGWFAETFSQTGLAGLGVDLLLAVPMTLLLAFLFVRPGRLDALVTRADTAAYTLRVKPAFRRSLLPSVLYVVFLLGVERLFHAVAPYATGLSVPLALTAAVALDLLDEWRFRHSHAHLVAAWPVHAGHAVDLVLADLTAAGIPAHARGANVQTLTAVFAPYVPATIFVPTNQADPARRRIASLFQAPMPRVRDEAPESASTEETEPVPPDRATA